MGMEKVLLENSYFYNNSCVNEVKIVETKMTIFNDIFIFYHNINLNNFGDASIALIDDFTVTFNHLTIGKAYSSFTTPGIKIINNKNQDKYEQVKTI